MGHSENESKSKVKLNLFDKKIDDFLIDDFLIDDFLIDLIDDFNR